MKFIYTRHSSIDKFAMLEKHKFPTTITRKIIENIVINPEHKEIRANQVIASKTIDSKHILRVVYRQEDDIILIITFYPAEKGRYYQ